MTSQRGDGNGTSDAVAARNDRWLNNQDRYFILFNAAFVAIFFGPLQSLVAVSLRSDTFSYIPFIPFISAYILYLNRKVIFSQVRPNVIAGSLAIIIGGLLHVVGRSHEATQVYHDKLAMMAASMVIVWSGGFALIYGLHAVRKALFPLLFLFFIVPVPNAALERIILMLQAGSAEVAYAMLKIAGIPMTRDGNVFHLITVDIEVAKECSGIRSSLSLIITGLLAGYFFLRTGWAKLVLLAAMLPITILKNGFRIAALSILGVYVDERILASDLHTRGGILFFILALVLVWGVIVLLRRVEGKYKIELQDRERCKVV